MLTEHEEVDWMLVINACVKEPRDRRHLLFHTFQHLENSF